MAKQARKPRTNTQGEIDRRKAAADHAGTILDQLEALKQVSERLEVRSRESWAAVGDLGRIRQHLAELLADLEG